MFYEIIVDEKHKPIEYVISENGCHICTSHCKDNGGYPMIAMNCKLTRLSRFIYMRAFGHIAKGLVIRHKCDNRSCININHLEIGTQQDNIDDKMARGREAKGERSGRAKLTQAQVNKIKVDTRSSRVIAGDYKVSHKTILEIKSGKTWRG